MLEILTPPVAALVSLNDAKAHLGVTGTDSDAVITSLIASSSAAVTSFIGRPLLAGEYRETFRLIHLERVLTLSRWPVVSVASITEGDDTLAVTDYEISADEGLLHRLTAKGRYQCWANEVTVVTYEAGYAEAPADVQAATMSLIADAWSARGRDPGMRSIGIGSINLSYFDPLARNALASVEHLLQPYRAPVVG